MSELIERHALALAEDLLRYGRVLLLLGPRQAGKSTLAAQLVASGGVKTVVTLDDRRTREVARSDPTGFIATLTRPVAIDEIQRVPELLMEIKQVVDRDTSPGQFVLTGSANILTAPRVLDALTGRTDIVSLWPLAQSEIEGSRINLVDRLFDADVPHVTGAPIGTPAWAERAVAGGFAEARGRPSGRARASWFESYITSLVQRDLRELSDAHKLAEMPGLLRILASQAASLFVSDRVAQRVGGLSRTTVQSYVRLLETIFVVRSVPAWRPGLSARERLAPKLLLADTGLLAHLLGASAARAAADQQIVGKLFENFVGMEVVKHAAWAERLVDVRHYRHGRREIDLVLEARDGTVVAIEAKAGASFGANDWRALAELRDMLGDRFRAGLVVHAGESTLPLGDRLWGMPVSGLWAE